MLLLSLAVEVVLHEDGETNHAWAAAYLFTGIFVLSIILLLLFIASLIGIKDRFAYQASKGAVLASVQAAGVEVAKSIEGLEPKELCEAALVDEVYARDAATAAPAPALTKAAPRGGRKLVSRKKPAEAAAE